MAEKYPKKFVKKARERILQPEELVNQSKSYYFDNLAVERLLYDYHETACTDIRLRDEIMSHASELIRQIIRANNLHTIYPGRDDSSFGDLFQVGWSQIELSLYKYRASPHCLGCFNVNRPHDSLLIKQDPDEDTILFEDLVKLVRTCPHCGTKITRNSVYYKGRSKVFNLWSQVSRTVVLAYIKRESRDKKNYTSYQSHLIRKQTNKNYMFDRFLEELNEMCKYNNDYLEICESLEELYKTDDRAHEGLISKLVEKSGKSRSQVTDFLKFVRLRSFEFSDAPVDERPDVNLQLLQQSQFDTNSQQNDD